MTREERIAEAKNTRLIVNVDGYKVSFAVSDEITFFQLQYALHAIYQGMIKQAEKNGICAKHAAEHLRAAIEASKNVIMEELEKLEGDADAENGD